MTNVHPYSSTSLIVRPRYDESNLVVSVTPDQAGWETLSFQVRRLTAGSSWSSSTGGHELALVMLSGQLNAETAQQRWPNLGGRANVFAGLPHALYLPCNTNFILTAASDAEFALAWVATQADREPRLITPKDIEVEIRGGDHATRQINKIIPPGFQCDRLVVVEVYTPGGNWSSYPPHKHDVHKARPDGSLLEADLDEIYYYKINRPEGYALQRIYTDPESPLHRAGHPIDAVVVAHNDDVVLIPEGYHPVSSPVGYTTYYLNVLAGSAQSLAATDDPQYAWVKDSYQSRDPRIPIYPLP